MCGSGFDPTQLQKHTDKPRVIGKNQGSISGHVEREIYDDSVAIQALEDAGYPKARLVSTPTKRPYPVGETFSRVQSVVVSSDKKTFYGASDYTRFPECVVVAVSSTSESKESTSHGGSEENMTAGVLVSLVLSGIMVVAYIFLWRHAQSHADAAALQDTIRPAASP